MCSTSGERIRAHDTCTACGSWRLKERGIDTLHIQWMNALMDKEGGHDLLDIARTLRMPIWAWTVNDYPTALEMYVYGAERIFTDKPELFA